MSCDWSTVTLAQITSRIGDGLHGTPKYDDSGDYYFINGNNLSNGKVVINEKTKRTDESQYLKHRKDLNSRTLLVSINGTLGNIGTFQGERVFLGKSVCYLNILPNVNKDYVMYVLMSKHFQDYIHNLATGSTIKNVGLKLIREYEFQLPDITTQNKIANVLVSIDSKISLNTQTNQTLEAMAQAIFKSWFVDFDPVKAKMQGKQPEGMNTDTAALFPDKLVESELGLIPEGWIVKPFKKVIDKYVDNRGKTPPVVEDGIPLVEVKHLPENSAFPNLNTDKRVTEETFDTWFRVHVEPKDILISTVGTIGRTSFVKNTNFGIAQNVLGLRFGKVVEPEYMFYTVKAHRFQHDMDARLVTTVQSSIKRKDLDTIDILVPPSNVQKEFCKLVGSLLDGQYRKNAENIELASLRDALLPKLLSGELLLTNYREVANV
ncbi:restriction endonuclease subunit S [Salinivibrio kushneri]|uniref:restriction endonuclease subunit S n=1 Tax=Salinivibrio kushneri TaxID=1908198 RepID=UPI0022B2CC4C|nr:restriction endonuclease subunit S [Salinivibrio kushneri]WBA17867.1 restriction endonuclease subunit S [Salinivibrio kushneri]